MLGQNPTYFVYAFIEYTGVETLYIRRNFCNLKDFSSVFKIISKFILFNYKFNIFVTIKFLYYNLERK